VSSRMRICWSRWPGCPIPVKRLFDLDRAT
jgi:hypothetical protein